MWYMDPISIDMFVELLENVGAIGRQPKPLGPKGWLPFGDNVSPVLFEHLLLVP